MKQMVPLCWCFLLSSGVMAATEVTVTTDKGPVAFSSFADGSLRVTRGTKVSPELVFTAKADRELSVRETPSAPVRSTRC